MIVEDANAQRMAIRYKSTLKLAHETARTAGRQARQLHAEAMLVNDVCGSLLGHEAWHSILDRPHD